MGLIGRQLLHTNPTMKRDTGLRVLEEMTAQVGLRGATSGEEIGTSVFSWSEAFWRWTGRQWSNQREVVKIWMGGHGVHYSPPRPYLWSKPHPQERDQFKPGVRVQAVRETRRGSALVNSKPNKPSFRKPCRNKNGGECQKGWLPRPRFSAALPFQQASDLWLPANMYPN